jgi:tetratricopeptide (TPR) repeat protein
MSSSNNLDHSLEQYESALNAFQNVKSLLTAEKVLSTLRARDRVQSLLKDKTQDSPESLIRLIELDKQLIFQAPHIVQVAKLADWRTSLAPPENAWWWFLDKQTTEGQKRSNNLLNFLAGVLIALSILLALEIVQRFWSDAPDIISIWGTLLALSISVSPFATQGREVPQWLLERLPFIKLKYHAEIMVIMSGLALLVLLGSKLWLLPGPLTTYYNNAGMIARTIGNLGQAQQMFQRASSLNPERVVPFYNLAEAYRNVGLDDKAVEWYQKAIERDASFTIAYSGLGELYNQHGNYQAAEQILLAGLTTRPSKLDELLQKVSHYTLISNLGWSYWGQQKISLAQTTFEAALELEVELKSLGIQNGTEYRLTTPHFFLAQIYEQSGDAVRAQQQWEEALRFLDQSDWRQQERYQIVKQHLQTYSTP